MSYGVKHYNHPSQFEPLLPRQGVEPLVLKTRQVVEGSAQLQRSLHPASLEQLKELVRSMNSYYSNLIEGQGTHPRNIERALRHDFSAKPAVAQRQRIAVAHIDAERDLEQQAQVGETTEGDLLKSEFLVKAHAALYSRLEERDRITKDGLVIAPGVIREQNVDVGQHVPPEHSAVPAFLKRMDEVYPTHMRGVDGLLIGIAAAHHRAAWVHPFADGNGRACRLQTQCALRPTSGGLWSVSRALARQRDAYYAQLADADQPRQGDLDGRANLSEKMLVEWCSFFIEACLDQVQFMTQMLDLDGLRERITALIAVRSSTPSTYPHYRKEVVLPLQHVLMCGPVSRGDFKQMTGLADRTAQQSIGQLLRDGVLKSKGPKGSVYMGFPLDTLNILFPNLYPEAATANLDN